MSDTLAALLKNYEPPGPAGDPNSLGYALQGPAAPVDTSNVLGAMGVQQTAKEHEGPEAMARLLMTLGLAPLGSAPTGALAAGAARRSPRQYALEQGREAFNAKGPNWMESGQRVSPLGNSTIEQHAIGSHGYVADMALRRAGGDYEKALALVADNPRAANVLKYWHSSNQSNNFRPYADPARSQAFWEGADAFNMADAPPKNLLNAIASPVPGTER